MGDTHRDKTVLDVFPASPLVEYTIAVMNASLAAMNMNLAAEALGVASVMLSETGRSGFLDAGYLCRTLGLPPGVIPLMTIVFAYPRGACRPCRPSCPLNRWHLGPNIGSQIPAVMHDWLAQMIAGYRASHLTSTFDAQLRLYQSKIGQAERDLQTLVFGDGTKASPCTARPPDDRPSD